jgi:metal-responsive CopG/Arc/MetJ family transcriptional regulator
MKRATITLPDDLEQALERFVDEQDAPVQLTAVVQTAVREYLGERGYLPSRSKLRIRPADRGSGQDDVSVSHDQYLSSSAT